MNLSDFPHIQAELRDVLPIVPDLWQAVEEATAQAKAIMDGLNESYRGVSPQPTEDTSGESAAYDPWYFSHSVRYVTRLYLNHRGRSVELEVDTIPNSGLRVRHQNRWIRLRKATPDGGVPDAGGSQTMQSLVQLILSDDFFAYTSSELLFLWHATPFGDFEGLSVVFSTSGKQPMSRVLACIWLPNPAESGALQAMVQGQDVDLEVEVLGDLPIEPLTADAEDEAEMRDDTEQAQ